MSIKAWGFLKKKEKKRGQNAKHYCLPSKRKQVISYKKSKEGIKMFLTAKDIQILCPMNDKTDLVSKPGYLDDEQWKNRMEFIEGNRFDITVESIWLPDPDDDGGFLGVDSRRTPKLVPFPRNNKDSWCLSQGFYHILAGETFNMPAGVFGTVKSRRTIFGFSGFVVGTDTISLFNLER